MHLLRAANKSIRLMSEAFPLLHSVGAISLKYDITIICLGKKITLYGRAIRVCLSYELVSTAKILIIFKSANFLLENQLLM